MTKQRKVGRRLWRGFHPEDAYPERTDGDEMLPLFRGGQGRSEDDVRDGGGVLLAWAVVAIVFAAGLALGALLRGGAP